MPRRTPSGSGRGPTGSRGPPARDAAALITLLYDYNILSITLYCYINLCYITLYYIIVIYYKVYYIILYYIMLCYIISDYIILYYVILYYIMMLP